MNPFSPNKLRLILKINLFEKYFNRTQIREKKSVGNRKKNNIVLIVVVFVFIRSKTLYLKEEMIRAIYFFYHK